MYGENRGFGQAPPVNVGDEIDVTIEAVGEKGDGIARKDGFILFVPNTREGEHVRIRVNKVLRKVGFADVVTGDAPAAEELAAPETEPEALPAEELSPEATAEEPAPEASVEDVPPEAPAELPPAPEEPDEPAESPEATKPVETEEDIPPIPDEPEENMEAELPPPPESPDGMDLPSEEELKKMEDDLPTPEDEEKKDKEKKEE